MKINKEWHLKHRMPTNPTLEQRINWHFEHQKHCSCRPLPEQIAKEMKERGIKF